MNELILRMNILGGMNSYILEYVDDEDIIEEWFTYGIPDGCDEEMLREIAEDINNFEYISKVFGNLMYNKTF